MNYLLNHIGDGKSYKWKYVYTAFILTYMVVFSGALHFFLGIQVTTHCPFISAWRTPFATSCRTGLLAVCSLGCCLPRNALISPLLKEGFAENRILGWQFVFFHHFEVAILLPSGLHEKSLVDLIEDSWYVIIFFLQSRFSCLWLLSVWHWCESVWISLSLLEICWDSWTCRLMFFITFGKVLAIIFSNNVYVPFSSLLVLLYYLLYHTKRSTIVYYTPCIIFSIYWLYLFEET